VFNFPIPSSHANIIALTHPIQGGDISTICGKHVLTATINFHESVMLVAKAPKPLASVGLILNKFSNEGMTLIDTSIYINGIKSIMEWCRQNSILLKIRLKPSGTCIQWLVNELGLNVEDLISNLSVNISDFGRECDVCLMYDAPTSGAIDFLRNSIPVLSTVIRDLCPEETRIISSEIVSRNSITETLAWLDSFKNDPINLILFRTRQFGSYASLLSQSSPLRMFL
jgi:hypothetical protein